MRSTRGTSLILFLGSGVSLASGLPSVLDIMTALRRDASQIRIQELVTLLEAIDRDYVRQSAPYEKSAGKFDYTGQIYRTVTTYEDLFYLASRISLNGMGLAGDATVGAFAELVRRKGRRFIVGSTGVEQSIDLAKLAGHATRFIEEKVASLLYCE